jgi:pSer/pThr/pTyr-binding forkhead associated (FHA) protein
VFVVDITFQGDSGATERVFVRRPYLTIGADETAHVMVSEMSSLGFSLQVQRDLARSFKVSTLSTGGDDSSSLVGGTYEGRARLDLGIVVFEVTALDLDLLIRENEALDRAGVRILRRAFSDTVPEFPALVVTAPVRAVLSFSPDQPLIVGRSRTAAVRLDVPTVSLNHARIGYESGEFWVEDLGSTNGTFVGDKQVSSRVSVQPGTPIRVSKNATLIGASSRKQLADIDAPKQAIRGPSLTADTLFPSLVSMAEVARPSRVVLRPGATVEIGRDPSCGLWLGAPHVSRRHCTVSMAKNGMVTVADTSTNGTAFDEGMLRSDQSFQTADQPIVLDFGAGVTVALCFNGEHEQTFQRGHGAPFVFREKGPAGAAGLGRSTRQRERRTTTWFNVDAAKLQALQPDTSTFARMRAMISGLTLPGRVALAVIVLGFFGLLALIGAMLFSGLQW